VANAVASAPASAANIDDDAAEGVTVMESAFASSQDPVQGSEHGRRTPWWMEMGEVGGWW
jgi:hypothetical protein